MTQKPYTLIFSMLTIIIILLMAANLCIGTVHIPFRAIIDILSGNEVEKSSWNYIIWESRIPQCFTALTCGAALSVSGLMLQTVFHNPLADSSILGISSGSSLGVAIVILVLGNSITAGNFELSGFISVIAGAFLGALLVMGTILLLANLIKNQIMLLIVGIMIGYITSSAISLMNFFSKSEEVYSFIMWGMGNFGSVSLEQLPYFIGMTCIGLFIAILLIKPLNALLLGERYAENLGINIKATRNWLLISTGLLTAITTAYCGPVSFIGLAVPHIARLLTGTSNHNQLMPFTLLLGSIIALLCNLICILPGESGILPLNAVTPIIGGPIIIYVIINQRKIQYFN